MNLLEFYYVKWVLLKATVLNRVSDVLLELSRMCNQKQQELINEASSILRPNA